MIDHPRTSSPLPPDRSRVAAAVIGLLALVGVVVVLAASSDALPSAGAGLSGSGGPGGGSLPTSSRVQVTVPTGVGNGAAGASSASSGAVYSKAFLEAHFPPPPGGRPWQPAGEVPPHQRWYVSGGTISSVRDFYDAAISRIGPGLRISCGVETQGSVISGWSCAIRNGNAIVAELQIRNNVGDDGRGRITTQGYFD